MRSKTIHVNRATMTIKKSIAGLLAVAVLVAGAAAGVSSTSSTGDERATQYAKNLVCMKLSWPPKPCRSA